MSEPTNPDPSPQPLPSIAGRMQMTHEQFQGAALTLIMEYTSPFLSPDKALMHVLCEAVRCSRECCELAKAPIAQVLKTTADPKWWTEVETVIKEHEQRQGQFNCGSKVERLQSVIAEYQRGAEQSFARAKEFCDRMQVDLRALELILSSALNSSTHKEKDAHLRIVSKLLGSALTRLREQEFEQMWKAQFFFDRDPFQCDFPVRELKERIYQLEAELKAAKPTEVQPIPAQPTPTDDF